MTTEFGNMKDHATSVHSLVSRCKDGQHAGALHLESDRLAMDEQNSSLKHSECESLLKASPQQQEATKLNVETKESWADWGVVGCVFLSNLLSASESSGFGVFYPFLVEQFDATTAAVGWCSSINGFFQSFVALFASYPIQAYGCRLPGAIGCLLLSIGLSLSYLAPNLVTIYFTHGVIGGSGAGLASLSTNIIIHQRLTRNRKLASGIGYVGFGCGGIVASIFTNYLIQSYGWRGAFLILGAIQAQRIPLCLLCRTPKRLTSQLKDASGIIQRRKSGHMILKYLKETFNFSILRQARYSVYAVAYVLHTFCVSGYWPHTVNRAVHVGLTRDQGVTAAALMSTFSTITKVPVSFIANHPKVHSSLIYSIGMFFAFLSIVALFYDTEIIGTMTSTALFGIHLGCTATVTSVVAVDLLGVALISKSLAILQFIGGFANLVSTPLIGWVFDLTGDYNKAFAIIGCMAFVSASLMVALTFVTKYHRKSIAEDNEILPSDYGTINPPTPRNSNRSKQ